MRLTRCVKPAWRPMEASISRTSHSAAPNRLYSSVLLAPPFLATCVATRSVGLATATGAPALRCWCCAHKVHSHCES